MERIPTKNGVVQYSRAHGADERAENVAVATYFAEKYGHEIDLLPRSNDKKTADAYNRTLGVEQEYKVNKTPTHSAISKELRRASRQANHVVLHIVSGISNYVLKQGIKERVRRKETIETVTILRNGEDKTYTRAQIMSVDFEL